MPNWKATISGNISRKLTPTEAESLFGRIWLAARDSLSDLGVTCDLEVKQADRPKRKPAAKKAKPAGKEKPAEKGKAEMTAGKL